MREPVFRPDKCIECGKPIIQKRTGRIRRYCPGPRPGQAGACASKAKRRRQWEEREQRKMLKDPVMSQAVRLMEQTVQRQQSIVDVAPAPQPKDNKGVDQEA